MAKSEFKAHKNFINNQWTASKKTRDVVNPFNQETIGVVAEASKKDVDDAVAAARQAFDRGPWRESTAQQRGRILFAMADLVRRHSSMLATLESRSLKANSI
jgi:acyl-CoA reductase-like NAD-dependent aldehyde dehydrogenase